MVLGGVLHMVGSSSLFPSPLHIATLSFSFGLLRLVQTGFSASASLCFCAPFTTTCGNREAPAWWWATTHSSPCRSRLAGS